MDPFSLVAIGVTALVCSATGFGLGRWRERRTSPTITDYQEIEAKHKQVERELGTAEHRVGELRGAVARLDKQRGHYRKMAESHEIKMPEIPKPVVETGSLWEGRRYCGHPEANIRNLTDELKAAGVWGKEVVLRIEILGSEMGGGTGFSKAIHSTWKRGGKATKDIGPWQFHGPGKRAVDDLMTFLMDNDTGLTKVDPKSKGRKVWIDEDSTLVFKIDVAVTEVIKPFVPEVQVVEVAVVEERVVERIVEKEVFISIPAGREPELCGHTAEEIRKVVDDALARKVADEEVERLSRLASPESTEDLRKRLAQVKRAKQGT